jgi:pyruvate formate lyase activating enzyme
MLQIDFLEEILKVCKEKGIHTAVDTAGHVPNNFFDRIIPYTDLFLYDIKAMNSDVHKQYTGVENCLILENLARLLKDGRRIWVRVPIIPTINDTAEEMKAINDFFKRCGYPEKIELLPYHSIGKNKYSAMNREVRDFDVPSQELIDKLKKAFN